MLMAIKRKLPNDILSYARLLRESQTDAEKLLWLLLRNRRLAGFKFRRQHPVGRFILDYYCHEALLAVELDGGQHLEETALHDAQRTSELSHNGIRVIRFWNNDLLKDPCAVLESIFAELVKRTEAPSPLPLSQRERGE